MIIGKMEEIDKRFRFYHKSIFFSDLSLDQCEKNTKRVQQLTSPTSPSALGNGVASLAGKGLAKPPKTMSSIGNNTITFYSPKALNRPMTVNPTPLVEPRSQLVESVKNAKAETYLTRLLRADNGKKFTPKPLLGRNPSLDTHLANHQETLASRQAFENIKIKQHVFNHYPSKSNPPLLLATNTQLSMSNDISKSNQKQSPSGGSHQQKSSALGNSNALPKKSGSRLNNEDLSRYLAFQKKKSHYTNTSKLLTSLNRINQQQEQSASAAFKSNSMMAGQGASRQAHASSLKPDTNAAQTFMSQKPGKSSKLGERSPRPQQQQQQRLNNAKWTSITDSQEKLILNSLASNNYFKYTASQQAKEEPSVPHSQQLYNHTTTTTTTTTTSSNSATTHKTPQSGNNNPNSHSNSGYKHNLSSELMLARSLTYDFKFKTDFVDSKLKLATVLGKSGESLNANANVADNNSKTELLAGSGSKTAPDQDELVDTTGDRESKRVAKSDEQPSSEMAKGKSVQPKATVTAASSAVANGGSESHQLGALVYIEQPKLTVEEEMLVIKSKNKCDDWFDRHFLYSNTSSPINDLNEF